MSTDMRKVCEALGFDPTNHHNANKCPYCRPQVGQGSPMSTAPKDGTQILAKMADSDSRIVVCWAVPGGVRANLAPHTAGWHVAWDGYGPLDEPECWWPLP